MDTYSISPTYPWAESFIECALRAIRRTHLDFGPRSLGQRFTFTAPNFFQLNEGLGVALAGETTVCAGIVLECMNSQLLSGVMVTDVPSRDVKRGLRFYQITREVPYKNDGRKLADIVMRRYDPLAGDDEAGMKFAPCYIEAKRARLWTDETTSRENDKDIVKDIQKLRGERSHLGKGQVFLHLLVWDICTAEERGPHALLAKLNDPGVSLHCVRWNPVSWKQEDLSSTALPSVDCWLWVALFEVDRPESRLEDTPV